MDALKNILSRTSFLLGFKLLLVIVFAEVTIMSAFNMLGISRGPAWADIADALLLGVISSIVIYIWVLKPLKQAKQQNDLFNTVINNLDVGVVVTDPHQHDHPITYVNPAFTRITGYSADEVIGKNPRFMQDDDIDQHALQLTRQAMQEEKSIRVLQCNRRKDGSSFWNDLHLNPIFNDHGQVQLWVGLINDVTAAKMLEKENQRWASALQQSDEAVCVFNQNGIIEFANEAFCSNMRLRKSELQGKSIRMFWKPDSSEVDALNLCLQQTQSWSGRHTRYRADQTSYDALTSITPIYDEQGIVSFVAVHRDISSMVAIEAQLRQSQKMEAVGMLVGGIAHDFNNVLAGMLGNLYLIRKRLEDAPDLAQRIEKVEQQGYGAAGMVRQLLSFSRKDIPEVKDIDLAPFIKELVKFAGVSVPENIELVCHVENSAMVSSCDPVQLQQSLLNLIVNATHAVQDNTGTQGKIVLQARLTALPDKLCMHDDRHKHGLAKPWVCISVRDNGIGMNQAMQDKIFEPFYTTKPSGSGTGLGLAMVKSYIEVLGGFIDVESAPEEGACMSIYLPLSVDAHLNASPVQVPQLRTGNGELILLADDDMHVLEALSDILESANYHVLKAANGEQAMQLFNSHAANLDMAILDVIMPKASGLQAAAHMRLENEHFPVTLMTGYDKEGSLLSKTDAAFPVLRKPWTLANLNDVLAASLTDSKHVNMK